MKDPYLVLGIEKGAHSDAIEARYKELKNKYSEDRFLPGYEGNEAAEKLSELEAAYDAVKSEMKSEKNADSFGSDFGYVEKIIQEGRYVEAQNMLDAMQNRPAEWHYLQSIIFYRREWIADSKTQLEMAVNMDPDNQRYRTALERMKSIDGNPRVDPSSLGQNGAPPPVAREKRGPSCSECCMAYLCADCLCSNGCCR